MQRAKASKAGRRRTGLLLAACAWLAGAAGCTSVLGRLPHGLGSVEGALRFAGQGGAVPALGPVVVYLQRVDRPAAPGGGTLVVSDAGGVGDLGHELVVLTPGQSLRFASESGLEHRLFAVSGPRRVDVAVPANGRSRPVRMERLGWTRFYCSLHQDEAWDAFVAPSPHFARVGPEGEYRIAHVPPGDYTLSIWSAAVDGPVRTIRVGVLGSSLETIWLDPARVDP